MLKVRYFAPFAVRSGYAQAAHDYLAALHATGQVDLDIRPMHECDTDRDLHPRFQHLAQFCEREDFDPDVVAVHTVPHWAHEFVTGDLTPADRVPRVCVTTWETSKLPRATIDNLTEHFNHIIVPSKHNYDVFEHGSVLLGNKTSVIPHTFDPRLFKTAWEAPKPSVSPYVFYSIGVWAERKNPIGLLKAYLSEFTDKDNVVLKILTPNYNKDDITYLIRCMGISNLPRVEFINERLSDAELMKLHTDSHCYVTLTHGEGWNLGAFEAAIVGNHIIATDWSGQKDFLKVVSDNYSPIDHFLTPAITTDQVLNDTIDMGGIKISPIAKVVSTGVDASQSWAEPNLEQAKMRMREAYSTRKTRKESGRSKLVEWFGYDRVGQQMLRALKRGVQ